MKKIVIAVFVLIITISKVYTYDGGHDSLLFDGDNRSALENASSTGKCFIQVIGANGKIRGTVIRCNMFYSICEGGYVKDCRFEDTLIQKGDTLAGGTKLEVEPGGLSVLFMWHPGADNNLFTPATLSSKSGSVIRLPDIASYCNPQTGDVKPEPVQIIKGTVEFESKESSGTKIGTKGKRSSVIHTNTKYTHEVKFEDNDTIDVIRVYEGSVEVSFIKADATADEDMTAKMGKLTQDMMDGKISAEEFQAKMTEFQSYGQNSMDLVKPVTVDEGNKCTVMKNSRKTEPIEQGDEHWWEK